MEQIYGGFLEYIGDTPLPQIIHFKCWIFHNYTPSSQWDTPILGNPHMDKWNLMEFNGF